jgi:hypothetical protein
LVGWLLSLLGLAWRSLALAESGSRITTNDYQYREYENRRGILKPTPLSILSRAPRVLKAQVAAGANVGAIGGRLIKKDGS